MHLKVESKTYKHLTEKNHLFYDMIVFKVEVMSDQEYCLNVDMFFRDITVACTAERFHNFFVKY